MNYHTRCTCVFKAPWIDIHGIARYPMWETLDLYPLLWETVDPLPTLTVDFLPTLTVVPLPTLTVDPLPTLLGPPWDLYLCCVTDWGGGGVSAPRAR